MKIGFVLDDSLDKADGVQQYVLTLGHWLQHQGNEVHYLVGQTERTDIRNVHSLSRNVRAHFNQNRMSTPLPADKRRIRQLLEDKQFDVLHVQMPYSPWLAGRVIRAAPDKTVVMGTFHIIPFSFLERFAARLLGVWLRRSLRRFDEIFSVSAPAQKFARSSFSVNSSVLPNVVDLHAMRAGKRLRKYKDDKLTIVFLGRLVERKGCMHLLRALTRLHEQHHLERVRVLICGKGPLEAELRAYVKNHRLGAIVHFVGFVPESEKANYLATADIAVMPSTGGESFGIVLIEAMAAGAKVVLGGDNVGYRSVIGPRPEQLVNPNDTNKFAKTLQHFIVNGQSRQKAFQWQSQYVEQFDVRVVGKQLLRHYETAIAKRAQKRNNGSK